MLGTVLIVNNKAYVFEDKDYLESLNEFADNWFDIRDYDQVLIFGITGMASNDGEIFDKLIE